MEFCCQVICVGWSNSVNEFIRYHQTKQSRGLRSGDLAGYIHGCHI
jgi:hypothetical protein